MPALQPTQRPASNHCLHLVALLLGAAVSIAPLSAQGPPRIADSAAQQIDLLTSIKTTRSATEQKISSRLHLGILH